MYYSGYIGHSCFVRETKIKKLLTIIVTVGAFIGLGFWLFIVLQPKDSATNPPDNKISNILPSIKLVISDDSFKTINDSKTLEIAIDSDNSAAISKVEYLLDDKVAARSIEAPFAVTISIAQLSAGEHTLQAIAYDTKGSSVKSKVFTFTVESDEVVPSDDSSSDMVGFLPRKKSSVVTASTGGSQNSSGNSGGDSGPSDPDDPSGLEDGVRTAGGWWSSLPTSMEVCSNGVLDGGPTSAPAGAITVPAGDNAGFSLNQANKTFWFAPGVHTLGSGIFSSITAGEGSTYIGAPGAIIDGQFINRYAFQGNATNVRVAYLEIRNFGVDMSDPNVTEPVNNNEGVINHDAGDGWTMEYLNAHHNDGAAIFMGSENQVRNNCMKDNGQYGFSMFKMPISGDSAIKDIVIDHNEISGNNQDDWESLIDGCGCTGAGKFWDVEGAAVTNNYVHDNLSTGLWADTNDIDFLFDSNWIEHNSGEGIWYEISYNATISRNVLKRNAWTTGQNNTGSPGPAIYISESGGDSRLQSSTSGSTDFQIKNNLLEDNFSGVSIYENSNRFCNSNGNTSKGYCTPFVLPTLIPEPHDFDYPNPISTTHPCYTQIKNAPYTADCRWHAKNVQVFNNEFRFDPTVVPCVGSYCGVQALFATGADNMNTGPTYGAWVPLAYNVANVQNDVMLNNNNKFYNNKYFGNWRFAKGYGEKIYYGSWRAAPFLQDNGSTFDGLLGPAPVANSLDTDTATLEGSIGHWEPWYSAGVTQSTLEAHSGTHSLKINVTDEGGWAADLNNWPGLPSGPGNKHISFWAKQGSGATSSVTMRVKWYSDANTLLQTDPVPLAGLTTGWQQANMNVTAPVGTVNVFVEFSSSSGTVGNTVYADDFIIGDI